MGGLKEECGVVAVYQLGDRQPERNVAPVVVRALLDMQNRGQLSAGLTSYNPKRDRILQTHKDLGSVTQVFSLNNPYKSKRLMEEYAGFAAIGHNRYATSGTLDSAHAQPFERVHGRMWKWFAIGFNGNLANYQSLKEELESNGYHITYHTDTEVMMHCINRELRGDERTSFKEIFGNLSRLFDGAYNIVFINASGEMVAIRDPLGLKPMCYGEVDDMLVVASESVVLTNLGVEEFRSLEPGELIVAKNGRYSVESFAPSRSHAHCFFEWVYFSNLASSLEGRSVYKVRHAIGKELAKTEPLKEREGFLVLPVPETANTVAHSFAFHLGLPMIGGLLRNRYVGRTFIDGATREETIKLKFTPLREVIEGRNVFLVDDTLVRGNTLKTVVGELRKRGRVEQVHVRIGNPPIMGPCFYGIDMPTLQELFATSYSSGEESGILPPAVLERMAAAIGADSLVYLSTEKLVKAVGLPKKELCLACINKKYPTESGRERYQQALEESGIIAAGD